MITKSVVVGSFVVRKLTRSDSSSELLTLNKWCRLVVLLTHYFYSSKIKEGAWCEKRE